MDVAGLYSWHDASLRTPSYIIYLGLVRRINRSSTCCCRCNSDSVALPVLKKMAADRSYRCTQTCVVTLYPRNQAGTVVCLWRTLGGDWCVGLGGGGGGEGERGVPGGSDFPTSQRPTMAAWLDKSSD